jgi:hypothetical protein
MTGLMQCSKTTAEVDLFDHLVGAGEQRRRHLDAERPRGLDVDKQLEARLSRQMYAPSDV